MTYQTDYLACGSPIMPPTPVREGAVFSGWEGLPTVMPAYDIYVYGYFNNYTEIYTLTYMVDGEFYATTSYASGSYINYMDAPYKEGYTFSGWEGLPAYMPANDIIVYAVYSANSYLLYFMLDGMVYSSTSMTYGSAIMPPEVPAREGYTFSGWMDCPTFMPANDVYVYGYYEAKGYIVTYMVDGEIYGTACYPYGAYIYGSMDAPTKEGYVFCGWDGLPMYMPAYDITVNAMYSAYSTNSYMVTYYIDGMVYRTEYVESGSMITPPVAPVRDGYVFNGWGDYPIIMPNYDVCIIGSYKMMEYTVTYMVDGEVYTTAIYPAGSYINYIDPPYKDGYTFCGWESLPAYMPTYNITVNAKYSPNAYMITYMVDGMVYHTEYVACGTSIMPPATPTREGFVFSGWEGLPDMMPGHNVYVTGYFVSNGYTLTYVLNGEVYRSFYYAVGTVINPLEMPMIEGYTFNGWEGLPEYMPAYDVTVNATYSVNSYMVTFMVDGMIYYSEYLMYGSSVNAPEAPYKEGYTFNGWSGFTGVVPAYDVTYEGSYPPNTYRIYYYLDDMLVHTVDVLYGDSMPWPPTLDGYPFIEWMGEMYDSMPAHDVVYIANVGGGIEQSATDSSQMVIYDLSGRKLSVSDLRELTKGGYIVNGKRVLVP